jgi:hypothetical protein
LDNESDQEQTRELPQRDKSARKQSSEAWQLVSSDTSKYKKKNYEHGLQLFTSKLRDHSEQTVRAEKREAFAFLVTAMFFAGIVTVVFAIGLYSLFRMIRQANHGLNWNATKNAEGFGLKISR